MKKSAEYEIVWIVVATGISSVVTQLVTIREFLAQFHGNEIVIALILFNWLTLGGVGTYLAHLIARVEARVFLEALGWISLLLPLVALGQILAIRFLRATLFLHGASVGFYPILAFSLATMAPYALAIGFVLPYSLFVIRRRIGPYPGNRIYLLDNLGDVCGGMLFSFLLVIWLTPLKSLLVAGIPLLMGAYALLRRAGRAPQGALLAGLVFFALIGGAIFEQRLLPQPNGTLIRYVESRYGRIEVVAQKGQHTLMRDGAPIAFDENRAAAEEGVHFALAQLERPHDILMLAAAGGMLQEVAKYHPRRIDYIELDPEITRAVFDFNLLTSVPGVRPIHEDGRRYLRRTKTLYDAILLSLPEPDTFQVNRFFTAEFFALAKARLKPGGILSFAVQGFDNYLAEPQRRKISTLHNTAAAHFAHVTLLPGQKIFFLCRDQPIQRSIPALLDAKGIASDYLGPYFHGDLTTRRIAYLDGLIDSKAPRNEDHNPILLRAIFTQWFQRHGGAPKAFVALLALAILGYLAKRSAGEFLLFTTGFATMGAEVVVIFAFQIFFGYVYLQIGLIVTVFLAGLLPGALLGGRLLKRGAPAHKAALFASDGVLALFMGGGLTGLILGGEHLGALAFLALGLAVSLVTGFQFPLVLARKGDDTRAATQSFSADLLGAALGTLVTSLVLIPFVGLLGTAALLCGVKLASLMVGALAGR